MDSTYAPQSPDLSSFLSSPPQQQQQQQLQQGGQQPTSQNGSAAYAPRSPVIPSFGKQQQHNPNYTQPQFAAYQQNHNTHASFDGTTDFDYNPQYMPPIPPLPPAHSFVDQPSFMTSVSFDDNPPSSQSFPSEHTQAYFQPKSEPIYNNSYPSSNNMSHVAPALKSETSAPSAAPPTYRNPNPNNVEIKTKFPVARIKRIMQADEEVGKVAQVTPVAVNKALELFMIALVEGAAAKAREKGGKRITAQHLKMVVQGDEQFDFLGEIVGRVAEVQEGAGGEGRKRKEKVNKESDSEEEEKKVRKPRGRKKKTDD